MKFEITNPIPDWGHFYTDFKGVQWYGSRKDIAIIKKREIIKKKKEKINIIINRMRKKNQIK